MGGYSEKCPYCDKWVTVRGALRDHIKAKHPGKLMMLLLWTAVPWMLGAWIFTRHPAIFCAMIVGFIIGFV